MFKIYLFKAKNLNNVSNLFKVNNKDTIAIVTDATLVSLLFLNWFHTLFLFFYCLIFIGTSKCWLVGLLQNLNIYTIWSSLSPKISQAHWRKVLKKEGKGVARSPVNIYDGEFCHNN